MSFNHSVLFGQFIERVTKMSWRCLLGRTGHLKGLLCKVPLVILGSLTSEVGLAAVHFIRRCKEIRSRPLFQALYLKQSGVILMRFVASSDGIPLESSAPMISLSRSKLPRIIPVRLRHVIKQRNARSDFIVRLYLSWFTLARVIESSC